MKRTSNDQFETMVTFMEEHGDLSKPTKTPRGRLASLNRWEELANLLNSDPGGENRTAEKWKKVWSDFKNNAKKKAARLYRAAGGTGGGPANMSKLSELENRALAIIGWEAATGLPVAEAGISEEIILPVDPAESQVQEWPAESLVDHEIELWNEPGPSNRPHIAPPPEPITTSPTAINVAPMQDSHRAATPAPQHLISPARPINSPSREGNTAPSRRTTPRRRVRGERGERRRQVLPTPYTNEAAEHFIRSDAEWRQLRLQQHQDELVMRAEANRIREMEVLAQANWQNLGARLLNLLEKVVNKYV